MLKQVLGLIDSSLRQVRRPFRRGGFGQVAQDADGVDDGLDHHTVTTAVATFLTAPVIVRRKFVGAVVVQVCFHEDGLGEQTWIVKLILLFYIEN
jgi:hypothetical protein